MKCSVDPCNFLISHRNTLGIIGYQGWKIFPERLEHLTELEQGIRVKDIGEEDIVDQKNHNVGKILCI